MASPLKSPRLSSPQEDDQTVKMPSPSPLKSLPLSSPQNDQIVKIVNGPKSYTVSKKILCSAIPYFEKMFSGHFTESNEEKIELDFPVAGFQNIMMALDGVLNLNMAIVLPTLNLAGYLCMEELKQKCLQYFHANFTLKQLPVVLKSFNNCGNFLGILDVGSFESFIEKYFLKIASTVTFQRLPIETIEYICKLNLNVDSEHQVFQAIKRWIDYNPKRKRNFERLSKCIRWCHVDLNEMSKFLSDQMIKDNLKNINCMPSHCAINCGKKRIKDKSLIVIHQVNATTIRISAYDEDLQLFVSDGCYKFDVTLSHELITNSCVSDIIYDSGRKGIRVDWAFRRYNYLDMIGKKDSHYGKILQYIFHEDSQFEVINKPRGISLSNSTKAAKVGLKCDDKHFMRAEYSKHSYRYDDNLQSRKEVITTACTDNKILEKCSGSLDSIVDDGTGYALITFHENSYFAFPFEYNWTKVQFQTNPSTQSLQIDDTIYLLNRDPVKPNYLHLRRYNQSTKMSTVRILANIDCIDKIEMVNYNGKLLLCDKLAEKIYCYNDFTKNWDLLYRIETQQTIIAVATIVLPTNLVNNW